MHMTPNKRIREISLSADAIVCQAKALLAECDKNALTDSPDITGARAHLSLIKQSVEMIEGQLAMMGL